MGDSSSQAHQVVTQSRFFTNEFNTAIIDGPLRIYFADRQESEALQIYFNIQENLQADGLRLDSMPMNKPHAFLMLYPNEKAFTGAFEKAKNWGHDRFGEHYVVGVNLDGLERQKEFNNKEFIENITEQVRHVFEATA